MKVAGGVTEGVGKTQPVAKQDNWNHKRTTQRYRNYTVNILYLYVCGTVECNY